MIWCNGNTTDFDSVISGSNPGVTSKNNKMKKITLIVVGLLATLFSYSQDFARVIKSYKLEFKEDKWITVATDYPKDMFVIIKDWDVTIGTYKFKTYDEPTKTQYEDHITYNWKCVNSDGVKCEFLIKAFNPNVTTHTLYSILYLNDLLMYEYECE